MGKMTEILIGLGSNLGDRENQLRTALLKLSQWGKLSVSTIHETLPVGGIATGSFLNQAAILESNQTAEQCLLICQNIEREGGRVRVHRWGNRTIDLDILLVKGMGGYLRSDQATLQVPHPLFAKRSFAYQPACEIAPDWWDCRANMFVKDMCRQ